MAKENKTKKVSSSSKKTTPKKNVKKTSNNKEKNASSKKNEKKLEIKNTKNENQKEKVNNKSNELKKKTIEKARGNLIYSNSSESNEISKLIKIVLIVTLVMIVFYFVTVVVTKKANEVKDSNSKATIQYDNIMIGYMLKIDGSYYVLIKDNDDKLLNEYETLVSTVGSNDDAPKVYGANLNDSFNKNYLSGESNYDSNLNNFKVKGTTLVKVKDHKIDSTFDDHDSIVSELESLK